MTPDTAAVERIKGLARILQNRAYNHGMIDQQDWSDKKHRNADDASRNALAALLAAVEALARSALPQWQPIETAPRNGRSLLMTDGVDIQVCYPKRFPRPIEAGDDLSISKPGDVWEYFRDDEHAPGHSWSMRPTHWMPPPTRPTEAAVQPEAANCPLCGEIPLNPPPGSRCHNARCPLLLNED